MKIVLLGKNGQLGQEIDDQAKKTGLKIESFSHEDLDIQNEKEIEVILAKFNPDAVINAAAYHVVPDCDKYPEQAFAVNCFAVTNLARLTAEKNIRFVTFSTDYVFDGEKKQPYTEEDTPNPIQMYGLSKYAGEIGALNYNSKSLVIRTNGVYGGKTGSRSKRGNFTLRILEEAKTKQKIEVADNQIVNPTYASDLAEKTLELLIKNVEPGLYHLANSGCCSWAEFAEKILFFSGMENVKMKRVHCEENFGGVRRPMFSALKNFRAEKYQIIMPGWEDALKRYVKTL